VEVDIASQIARVARLSIDASSSQRVTDASRDPTSRTIGASTDVVDDVTEELELFQIELKLETLDSSRNYVRNLSHDISYFSVRCQIIHELQKVSTASLAVQDLEARVVGMRLLTLLHSIRVRHRHEGGDEKGEHGAEEDTKPEIDHAHVIPFP